MKIAIIFVPLIALISVSIFCNQTVTKNAQNKILKDTVSSIKIDSSAKTIATRFSTPPDYERQSYEKNTFEYFLSNFPLKQMGSKVYYYNGEVMPNSDIYISVLDIDIGNKDLQQCADAIIRLRAEYLYAQKQYSKIHFNFTNGFRVDYIKWAQGNRIKISGNKSNWYPSKSEDYSYKTFREYLDIVFMYAGTLSLSKELRQIPIDSIQIGDIFVIGGSPGHAEIVVDIAKNKVNGNKIFMLAQSYMPAQSIHLLVNLNNSDISPWYDVSKASNLVTPSWVFSKNELKRFKN